MATDLTSMASAHLNAETTPLWSSVPNAVAPSITALVAIALAVAGYFKFIRGRTFQPRVTLNVTGHIAHLPESVALVITVTIRNEGQSGLVIDPMWAQSLDIFIADEAVWADALDSADGNMLWFDGTGPHRHIDVFENPGLFTFQAPRYRSHPGFVPPVSAYSTGGTAGTVPAPVIVEPGESENRSMLVPVDPATAYLLLLTFQSVRTCGSSYYARP